MVLQDPTIHEETMSVKITNGTTTSMTKATLQITFRPPEHTNHQRIRLLLEGCLDPQLSKITMQIRTEGCPRTVPPDCLRPEVMKCLILTRFRHARMRNPRSTWNLVLLLTSKSTANRPIKFRAHSLVPLIHHRASLLPRTTPLLRWPSFRLTFRLRTTVHT